MTTGDLVADAQCLGGAGGDLLQGQLQADLQVLTGLLPHAAAAPRPPAAEHVAHAAATTSVEQDQEDQRQTDEEMENRDDPIKQGTSPFRIDPTSEVGPSRKYGELRFLPQAQRRG